MRYEDFKLNATCELSRLVTGLTGREVSPVIISRVVDEFSFENQSGRKPGSEGAGNFVRKGIVGDWRNYFSAESEILFQKMAGDQMAKLGYEK